ncbi:NUDIX domain-containing protein [Dictyobacter formicarum]|uniref:ADP-ribose pyrophosphatase n=1 Tax=Dictyobacter formicarum TaxID=2778368 RepID=A0ABQ3VBC2_9CHLR|nr:NUDIX hydrolase [Dictyobacter formicarum]GHO83324.1 ADP-ribose pyrophosphatase [Dictyobacter formicarum]
MLDQSAFYESLPRKRVGAAALFLDQAHNILIVNPTYTDHWLLPGGTVELDEAPHQGCVREIEEEIGLMITLERLLCVEYLTRMESKNESLQFIFYGGMLTPAQIAAIKLQKQELSDYAFVSLEEALPRLSSNLAGRLPYAARALEMQQIVYLENGQLLFS